MPKAFLNCVHKQIILKHNFKQVKANVLLMISLFSILVYLIFSNNEIEIDIRISRLNRRGKKQGEIVHINKMCSEAQFHVLLLRYMAACSDEHLIAAPTTAETGHRTPK